MIIRTAERADIKALAALAAKSYRTAFGHSFSASDLAAHLEKNLSESSFAQAMAEDVILVAEADHATVGFVQFGTLTMPVPGSSESDGEIRKLYVHPDEQNRGIGSSLVEAALDHPELVHCEHIYLDVWEHNHGALKLYQKYGFEVIGKRSFAVESGAQTDFDLIMVRRP